MTHMLERTVMPEPDTTALSDVDAVLTVETHAYLVAPDGRRVELPSALFDVLSSVVRLMRQGKAVTVAPHDTVMTTQEAADFLGVSRPTVVKLLEDGVIPFTRPNRHRRVLLSDLVDYERRVRAERRVVLDALTRDGGLPDTGVPGFEATR
ncbi:helix-turn-helix domain-containing protein [Cellulomonas triticagri]|uniref:DNA-binding protein n=1 Tax=Cellulomonas triticagri TaxID=2483352 RepID=A0A3M2J6M5_9CELL|nr:helix-turn-helix domain-containing protein [Cellulomonas triticagri]RMI09069.1 DNA-binding protein [Cellulomonas triticagri]